MNTLSRCGSVALLLAAAACGSSAPEEVETATVVPVEIAHAEVGTIQAVVHASGVVVPAPGADLVVIAPETARIAEMPKAEGDRVVRGDLLVRFEIPTITSDAASRRAAVARAEARLANAKAADARSHDLFDRGVAARKEMEDADREIADAEAELTEAQAALQASDAIVERTRVVATFAGVVVKRSHNPGDLVEPSASDPVLRVVDPERLEISAAVSLADIPRVREGATARLAAGGEGAPMLRVISRPAIVNAGTAASSIRLTLPAATRYAVGTPVDVAIDAEERKGVLLIPAAALVREAAETFVFVAEGNKAHRRSVGIGVSDGTRLEVVSGLKAGETVIIRGQNGLPDEADIKLESAAGQ